MLAPLFPSPTPCRSAEARGGKMYPGNSAVGEVIEVGSGVEGFAPGDVVVTHCNGDPDRFGYPLRIWAYDMPDSIGWYSKEAVVGDWQIIHAPLDSRSEEHTSELQSLMRIPYAV